MKIQIKKQCLWQCYSVWLYDIEQVSVMSTTTCCDSCIVSPKQHSTAVVTDVLSKTAYNLLWVIAIFITVEF